MARSPRSRPLQGARLRLEDARDGVELRFHELESAVMEVVWSSDRPLAVADVQRVLERARDIAYTTVMTTLRILEEKGFVERRGKRGRAYLYAAAVAKSQVTESMTHEVANRLFGGSIKSLMLNLISDAHVGSADLAEIKNLIEQLEGNR
ncbi:MAG: BlaI/MecI/CopY family transcriptional regulator [Planctomycetales bacterium]|nr:BlaI/MecI/CopY family transcriptional regulator [Planctomycetales bacterium]